MNKPRFLSFISFLLLLAVCGAALPPSSNSEDISLASNLTYPPFPSTSLNVSAAYRFFISDTPIAIDFWHQAPAIVSEDVLMCLVEALSKIFGQRPADPIPSLSTFYYKRASFIHVQDLNPTFGRAHSYQDLANTLRGIGEYMTQYHKFMTTEFQVWEITGTSEVKIGSGGVGSMRTDLVSTGSAAETVTPACDHGSQHCVA